jgi:D-alanyl-lipoteichoic acid acyltransferase DltB (MBOAT superfamily)
MNLLYPQFIVLAISAILALMLLRGWPRWLAFFSVNVVFVASHLSPAGMLSTGIFAVAGYGLAKLAAARQGRGTWILVVLLSAVFVVLRGYGFSGTAPLAGLIPTGWSAQIVATAGLSFLYFKMLHVIVDSAHGTLGELRASTYTNYVFNFTAFLMGPIQRYQKFDSQWQGREPSIQPGWEAQLDAVNRILRGLVKKFVLAEALGSFVIAPEMDIDPMSRGELLGRVYLFYLYLYLDFSGYCDIMIGIGSLMGVRPPENFNLPFIARNVSDYWLRVHRSLTEWLTDYVFNPSYAAGLRASRKRMSPLIPLGLSLMLTMLVAGAWHGTTIPFFLFGAVHGVFLVVFRVYEHTMIKTLGRKRFRAFSRRPWVHGLAILVTYNLTSMAYLFFIMDLDGVVHVIEKVVTW